MTTAAGVKPRLEICVDTPDGLATAVAAGADRIELCASLSVGGLTPTPGMMAAAGEASVPVYAMVRPRPGDFVYGPRDLAVMLGDIAAVKKAGLAGVVLGASRSDRRLDGAILRTLRHAAEGLGTTLHRAFDLVPDTDAALETAIDLGFERILTSGGTSDAPRGRENLRKLAVQARGRIAIMAGGGVTPANVADLLHYAGLSEVHASAKVEASQSPDLVRWGFAGARTFATSHEVIAALRAAMVQSEAARQDAHQ